MEPDRFCSLASLLEAGGDTHPLFCLQRQLLGETHTCKWPSPAPDLSCSCCSSSLFDSSLVSEAHKDDISVAVPITPQHICTEAVMITPAMKKLRTPANIITDSDKEMWTQSMATPTCQRHHQSPVASEGWSTETSPQSDVGSSSGRLRNSARGRESLARVLFGRESESDDSPISNTQPFNPAPAISPLVLHATHHGGTPVSRGQPVKSPITTGSPRLDISSASLIGCSQELFDSPRISPCREEDETEEVLIEDNRTVVEQEKEEQDDCDKELPDKAMVSNSTDHMECNIDVLFFGNSQLEWSDLKENAAPDVVTEQSPPSHTHLPDTSPIVSLHSNHSAVKNTSKSFQYSAPLPSPIAVQTNDQLYSNEQQLQSPNLCVSTLTENNRKRLSDGNDDLSQLKKSKKESCKTEQQDLDAHDVVSVFTQKDLSSPNVSANILCSTPAGLPPARAFTSFKTPTVAAPVQQSASCPSRRVASAKRKNVRPFKTPRSAKSVSKEEESMSIARIMQQFGRPIPKKAATPQPLESTSCTSGFSTAGGRKLSVSNAAVQRAKQLMELETDKVINPTVSVGFSTASGNSLSVSASSMERAHSLTIDEHQPSTDPLARALPTGFTTPSGKRLSVSPASMERAHSLTIDEHQPSTDPLARALPTGFTTPSGKRLSVSAASMERAHSLTIDEHQPSTDPLARALPTGFTTPSGKRLSVSASSMERAHSLTIDEHQPSTDPLARALPTGFTTPSGKRLSVSPASMERAHSLDEQSIHQPSKDPRTLPTGFTTPSGKKLSVSAAAMERAHKLTTDDVNASSIIRDPLTCALPTGFSTPSGKKLSVSAAAMERAHSLTTNYLTNTPMCDTALSTGFSTPLGKKLSVSSAAMQRAHKLIAPDHPSEEAERLPDLKQSFATGFQTPSGKNITIHRDSMTHAMGLCTELIKEQNETITDHCSTGQPLVCEKEDPQMKEENEEELELQDIDMDTFGNFTQLSAADPPASPVRREDEQQDEDTSLAQLEISRLDNFSEEEDCSSNQPVVSPQNASLANDNTVTSDGLCLNELFECQTLVDLSLPRPSQYSVTEADRSIKEKKEVVIETKQDNDSSVVGESTESHYEKPTDTPSVSSLPSLKPASTDTLKVASGLQTASGDAVNILQSTLDHVRHKKIVSGLQTAGGQSVDVSLDSLEHVQRRFSDGQGSGGNTRLSTGLQTAAGDDVTVAAKSLKHVQKNSSSHPFPGLTTAAGNHVPISQAALQAVCHQPFVQSEVERDRNVASSNTGAPSLSCGKPVVTSHTAQEEHHTTQKGSIRPSYSLTTTPEGMLYDRHSSSRPLYARGVSPYGKRILDKPRMESTRKRLVEPVQTPALPSSAPRSHSTPYRRQIAPVWRGSLRASLPQPSDEPSSSPPLSPIDLTMSQLDALLDTSLTQCDPPLPPPSHSDSGFCSGGRKTASANSSMQSPVNREEASLCVRPQTGSLLQQRQNTRPLPLSRLISGRRKHLIRYTPEQLSALGVSSSVRGVSIENAPQFVFRGLEFFSHDAVSRGRVCVGDGACLQLTREGDVGVQELWRAFRSSLGVDRQLISLEWFINHYQWLVLKLATMEVCFPEVLGGRCLNPDWLMIQMKYRYDREIDRAERSVLHKVCEGDESSTRPMVLCVSKCLATHHNTTNQTPCLELTDGWYSMPAALDAPLLRLVRCGRVTVGTKLFVCGAELGGTSELSHPLQVKGSKWLKLSANSTRRAHWAARLGLHYLSRPPSFLLSSLYIDGGTVPAVKVIVSRVYPLLYMEKLQDGTNVFRNSKAEQAVARKWEEERQKLVEQVYQQEQQQFEKELASEEKVTNRRRSRRMNLHQLKQLSDGEEIYNAIKMSPDPDALQEQLSRTQRALLESYQLSLAAQQQASLQERISQALKEKGSKIPEDRHVVPLLRLCAVQYGDTICTNVDCTVSVWRPAQCVLELLCEGQGVLMSHLTASASRYRHGRLQLSATKTTTYQPLSSDTSQVVNYRPRQYVSISELGVVELPHGEFDTAGLVVCVTGSSNGSRPVDQVFLAHTSGCVLRVNVWEGLKSMEAVNVVSVGCVVAVSNLRLLERSRCLTTASAGDTTVFQQHPTNSHLVDARKQLTNNLPGDVSQFIEDLQNKLLIR